MFWLQSARLALKKQTALYVNPETGLPVIDQDAAHEFVCALNEQEFDALSRPDVQEQLRLWEGCPLDRMGCTILDMQTANVLVTVHDALAPERRKKFCELPLLRAADVAWKCVTK